MHFPNISEEVKAVRKCPRLVNVCVIKYISPSASGVRGRKSKEAKIDTGRKRLKDG